MIQLGHVGTVSAQANWGLFSKTRTSRLLEPLHQAGIPSMACNDLARARSFACAACLRSLSSEVDGRD